MDLSGLPGADRIERGLRDLSQGRCSADALLVAVAARRLSELGLEVPVPPLPDEPELRLYDVLRQTTDDPYIRYNAALSELDSFLAALESRRARS